MTKRLSRDQREKSIIDTSLKLFAEHGFEATSMRAIANTEDISESMLYRFFSNKYEILEKIMESEIKEIIKSFKNIFETINAMIPDLEVSLPIIGKMMMSQITENQNIIRFITRERGNLPHILNDLREKLNIKEKRRGKLLREKLFELNLNETIIDYFKRCKEAGNLREDISPKNCATIFIANFVPLIARFPIFLFQDPELEIEELIELQIEVLLHGLVPKK